MTGRGGDKSASGERLFVDVGIGFIGWLKLSDRGHDLLHRFAFTPRGVHVEDESRGVGC